MISVDRSLLFDVWSVLMAVNFDNRDELWEKTAKEVKKLLNESREKEE